MDRTHLSTHDFLLRIGVGDLPGRTAPFDPGYDPSTVESHLEQSGHLMDSLKISMACWLIADEAATRRKIAAARRHGVAAVTGGGPFEIAVASGALPEYLDLCADLGIARIECGEGFTELDTPPRDIVRAAAARGLDVQYEIGKKHDGGFNEESLEWAIGKGREWLDAGAVSLVVEARESAAGVGAFDAGGHLKTEYADRIADALGLDVVAFEAPNKPSQFAFLDHFGPAVRLCNVRLEELLRVEIYRRGIHSDAFLRPNLRPGLAVREPVS